MVARYLRKNNFYYCSNCMMRVQDDFSPFCKFCGAEISNIEEVMTELFRECMIDSSAERENKGYE